MQTTYDQSEIDSVAQRILSETKSKTILFFGEMGAGKTTLIKALIKALGAEDTGSSPTFSLVNEYETPNGSIYHFDLYRIESESEALDIGVEEYLISGSWIFIEWPEKILKFVENDAQKVKIWTLDEGTRKLKFC